MPDGNDLSPRLASAVELLRELPEPRPLWRAELLRRAATPDLRVERGGFGRRRWSVSPVAAIAAGLVCALIGAGTTATLLRRDALRARTPATPLIAAGARALPVRFTLVAPGAARVSIVGDFNRWDPAALPLRRSADGRTWEVEVRLIPGRYSYSFVVDGRLARDPGAPQDGGDDFGSPNSILMVRGS